MEEKKKNWCGASPEDKCYQKKKKKKLKSNLPQSFIWTTTDTQASFKSYTSRLLKVNNLCNKETKMIST